MEKKPERVEDEAVMFLVAFASVILYFTKFLDPWEEIHLQWVGLLLENI